MSGAPIAQAGPAQPMFYRQGRIITFDRTTLENTVLVGETVLTNLHVLGVADAAALAADNVVGIMCVGSMWAIIGRLVEPGTDEAEDAITQIAQRQQTASVLTKQSTTSASFVDLTTPGPSIANVLIPASGKVSVTISAEIEGVAGVVGVEVSGATSIAPSTFRGLVFVPTIPAGLNASKVVPFEGLPVGGLCTFTLKYRSTGVDTCNFADRSIEVEAL